VAETRYARADDGAHLGYQIRGSGPVDLLVPSYAFISVAAFDDEPHCARFFERLASFARLICFDWRGIGLSDPFDPAQAPSDERLARDVVAVLDAAGSERAAFLATLLAGPPALRFAADFPDRTMGLVLTNTTARGVEAPDYEFGVPLAIAHRFTEDIIEPEGDVDTAAVVAVHAPSVAGDPQFVRWWEEAGNRGASPAIALAYQKAFIETDVRALLTSIQVPTLVIQRRDTEWFRRGHGQYMAERIPGARYVELPGRDMPPFTENPELVLEEIEEFLTGARHVQDDARRLLVTLLFIDIVGSTSRAAQLGDQRWRELLDQYHRRVAQEVTRHRGQLVKSIGDGALATFDSPARAIRCARAIRDALQPLGLEIRAGLHTGEVDVLDRDVGGIAVHVASRVMGLAQPGEILVSSALPSMVIGSGITFESRGEHELKGVPGSWAIHAVV
jgi:class 3 adenylate cyclase/pimeloyl-ACP methyl ester carboxylesterase